VHYIFVLFYLEAENNLVCCRSSSGCRNLVGVAPSSQYTFVIFVSPVGPYFKAGKITPIKLLVTNDYHRSAPKGSGGTKAIGNYAPCFYVQQDAKKKGYNEVLFLDAKTDTLVEEAGASNFFCVSKEGVLYTPDIQSNTILPGIPKENSFDLQNYDRSHSRQHYSIGETNGNESC
jgi:branched-chain amino acid aminotransferase